MLATIIVELSLVKVMLPLVVENEASEVKVAGVAAKLNTVESKLASVEVKAEKASLVLLIVYAVECRRTIMMFGKKKRSCSARACGSSPTGGPCCWAAASSSRPRG